ncbi:MAG TPA: O-antigen ligase family protein [Pyrinomonadaceae bacterium]|nr:O-antigen ligase family protein [Pyrinomonadaceae bacterium]
MTTSVSNDVEVISVQSSTEVARASAKPEVYRIRHTLASRFLVLTVCVAIVLSALAYGTVHYWALSVFNLGALTILCLWVVDGWSIGQLRISKNPLQLPLLGAVLLGILQLLPVRAAADSGLGISLSQSLSLDPNATRLVIVQFVSLFVYFAAVLVFIDTPRRLHLMVRTIMIFGFILAMFGLTQSFTSPTKVYWIRELNQSTAFGPFINRHHFAGYMELTLALPLGLLFAGSVDREKKLLYLFLAGMMGVALFMTTSRGGVISLFAEVLFFVVVTAFWRKDNERTGRRQSRIRRAAVRLGLGAALVIGLVIGVAMIGGGDLPLNRLVDSVNTNDPTTGRAHFWSVTVNMIKAHPVLGTGLGAFGVIYTRFDTRNGMLRLEQAHNDYLQVLSDGGLVGAFLALAFVALLFARAFYRMRTRDPFRRGVALASLGGCLAVLVHSFFDFTLHTTANALLFLVLAALATLNGRVEIVPRRRKRRRSTAIIEDKAVEQPDLNDAVVKVI